MFAFSVCSWISQRQILADSGLAEMHLTCCLGLVVFEKEGAEESEAAPAL